MVGLLQGDTTGLQGLQRPQQQNQQPAQQESQRPDQQTIAQGIEEASPQEQAQYDEFVNNAFNLIFDEKTMPGIIERLSATEEPIDDLANTAALVTFRLQDSAQKAGAQIPDEVVFHAGVEILEELANLSEKAGIHEFSQEELEAATLRALDVFREMGTQAGSIDPEALKQQFGALIEADNAGQLNRALPGLEV